MFDCIVCAKSISAAKKWHTAKVSARGGWNKYYWICSEQCMEVFNINPLAYENEQPFSWRKNKDEDQ